MHSLYNVYSNNFPIKIQTHSTDKLCVLKLNVNKKKNNSYF